MVFWRDRWVQLKWEYVVEHYYTGLSGILLRVLACSFLLKVALLSFVRLCPKKCKKREIDKKLYFVFEVHLNKFSIVFWYQRINCVCFRPFGNGEFGLSFSRKTPRRCKIVTVRKRSCWTLNTRAWIVVCFSTGHSWLWRKPVTCRFSSWRTCRCS